MFHAFIILYAKIILLPVTETTNVSIICSVDNATLPVPPTATEQTPLEDSTLSSNNTNETTSFNRTGAITRGDSGKTGHSFSVTGHVLYNEDRLF